MKRPTHALLLMIALTVLATGCRTFKREAFYRDIVNGVHDTLPTTKVQPGYGFRSLKVLDPGDLIVVSYVNVDSTRRVVAAEYDKYNSTDTSLALVSVRDSGMPRTLSVAFHNVLQVYPVHKYESCVVTDPGRSLLWFFVGLPAIVAGSLLLAYGIVSAAGASESGSGPYAGLGAAVGVGALGMAIGVTTWILLTIPIR